MTEQALIKRLISQLHKSTGEVIKVKSGNQGMCPYNSFSLSLLTVQCTLNPLLWLGKSTYIWV